MNSTNEPTGPIEDRWSPLPTRALRWAATLDKQIERIDHRYQAQFMSIVNALEVQFETGAVPVAVRLLLAALLATAKEARVAPCALGLDDDVDRIFAAVAPKRRSGGTR
jgi:hypothetical protein